MRNQQQYTINHFNYIYEIKYRILYLILGITWIWAISYNYGQTIIYLLLPNGVHNILSTDITDIFITYVDTATTATVILGSGILITQCILFLRPGLYKSEALIILKLQGCAIIVFLALYAWIYPQIIQVSWNFFSSYSVNFIPIQLNLEPGLISYFKHVKSIAMLLTCLGPILISLGIILKYSTTITLLYYRKIFYLILIIIGTIISPPDPIAQLILSTFLISIYELYLKIKFVFKQYIQTTNLEDNQN